MLVCLFIGLTPTYLFIYKVKRKLNCFPTPICLPCIHTDLNIWLISNFFSCETFSSHRLRLTKWLLLQDRERARAPHRRQCLTPLLPWVIIIRRHQRMSVKTRWPGHFILSTTDKLWKCKSVRRRDGAEYNYASNLKLDEMMTVKCWTLYNHKLLISTHRGPAWKITESLSNHRF